MVNMKDKRVTQSGSTEFSSTGFQPVISTGKMPVPPGGRYVNFTETLFNKRFKTKL